MSKLVQGVRVFHPNQKGWGLGKVLSVTPENVDIFFVGTGTKRLSKSFVQLDVAEGDAAKNRLLDNLVEASQIVSADYVTTAMAIERFLASYPDGFSAPDFLRNERDAIVRAHQFCLQLLGEEQLTKLIEQGAYQDICDRARHLESMTNLLSKSEKTVLYSTLDQPVNQKLFSAGLADLFYGTDSEENRFKAFVRMLDLLEINRWPYATIFGFLRFPQENAFIKPTLVQNAAKSLCWRINYKPEPNWRTSTAVLRLNNYLRTTLVEEGLLPRDLIDIHFFMGSITQK